MKKNVSELQHELIGVNKQVDSAKKSGNKRQLANAREQRVEIWRELRDEHGMKPPSHVAKELDKRYGKAKAPEKKEVPAFRAEQAEKQKKEEVMVFTVEELYGEKEAARLAKLDAQRGKKEPVMDFTTKELYGRKGAARLAKIDRKNILNQVEGWLSQNKEYQKLSKEMDYQKERAATASEAISNLNNRQYLSNADKKNLSALLDNAYTARWRTVEAGKKMASMAKTLEADFRKNFASNAELLNEYGKYLASLESDVASRVVHTLPRAEQEIAKRINHAVAGLRPQQEISDTAISELHLESRKKREVPPEKMVQASIANEAKEKLFDSMVRNLPPLRQRTPEQQELVESLRAASNDPWVSTEEFLMLAELRPAEAKAIQLAFAGEPIRARVSPGTAVARGKASREPTAIARREEPEKKGPVKLARAETRKKEKEV